MEDSFNEKILCHTKHISQGIKKALLTIFPSWVKKLYALKRSIKSGFLKAALFMNSLKFPLVLFAEDMSPPHKSLYCAT